MASGTGERSVGSVLAERLGKGHAFVVGRGAAEALRAVEAALASAGADVAVRRVLGGDGLTCLDVRGEAMRLHDAGSALVADLTGVSPLGCAALRLGADALVAPLGDASEGRALVAIAASSAAGALGALGATALVDAFPDAVEIGEALLGQLVERDEAWGRASDCAQVACAYLSCHPAVSRVVYPGLKADSSFEVAARTLRGGFGPFVDFGLAEGGRVSCGSLRAEGGRAVAKVERLASGMVRLTCDDADAREVVAVLERTLAAASGTVCA